MNLPCEMITRRKKNNDSSVANARKYKVAETLKSYPKCAMIFFQSNYFWFYLFFHAFHYFCIINCFFCEKNWYHCLSSLCSKYINFETIILLYKLFLFRSTLNYLKDLEFQSMSKWTRLFSVNGLGLNFCGIFEDKNYRSALGKIGNSQKQWKD